MCSKVKAQTLQNCVRQLQAVSMTFDHRAISLPALQGLMEIASRRHHSTIKRKAENILKVAEQERENLNLTARTGGTRIWSWED